MGSPSGLIGMGGSVPGAPLGRLFSALGRIGQRFWARFIENFPKNFSKYCWQADFYTYYV
jgi:hypothetical protein